MKKFTVLLVLVFCFVALTNMNAQEEGKKKNMPEEVFGIGAVISNVSYGGQACYVLNQNIHIGAQFGFVFNSGYEESGVKTDGYTNFLFAPYFRYFMASIKQFNLFAQASFVVNSINTSELSTTEANKFIQKSKSNENLNISLGAEWFPYSSVGVFGGFNLVEAQLSPFMVNAGLGTAFIGIEWFL